MDVGALSNDEGEGCSEKLANLTHPREAQHMADLAQIKKNWQTLHFPPVVSPSP